MINALKNHPIILTNDTKINNYFRKIFFAWQYYILLLPAFILLVVFHYWPMYGVTLAFKSFQFKQGILGSPWVGFSHFNELFRGLYFTRALRNTVIISLMRIIISFPMPIVLSIMLNELSSNKYKRIVQTVSYFPHFISWIIIGGILNQILSPTRGIINSIIVLLGGDSIHFMADNSTFRWVLIISGIWKSVGWGTVVYLAAISGLDTEMYEASRIDGASRFQQILYITLPGMSSMIILLFILNLGQILDAGFDQIFNLYSPSVYETADIIDTYVYRIGLQSMEYSRATAAGLFKNIIGFMLVFGSNYVAKKLSGGERGIF